MSGADTLRGVLTRMANDYRRTASYYGNIEGRQGFSQTPRRILSNIGFPQSAQFSYIVPSRSHLVVSNDPRPITRITLHAYGVVDDRRRLISRSNEDRRIHTSSSASGVRTLSGFDDYLVSSELGDDTASDSKTLRLIRQVITASRGPAYHAAINRRGDVFVTAAVDDVTQAAGANSDVSFDIAVESALAISRVAHAASDFTSLFELPFTAIQLTSISSMIAKIRSAFPSIPLTLVEHSDSATGVAYHWPIETSDAPARNFSEGDWTDVSPFDHTASDTPAFFENVTRTGSFDLSTEVFRTSASPPASTGRSQAQTALFQSDTAGNESALLANYSSIAGHDRANDMQGTPRLQIFVERVRVAHRDAADATEAAGHVADVTSGEEPPAAQNVGPSTFDFATGLWGDGRTY